MTPFDADSIPREFLSFVNSIPGCLLVLLPDTPHYTIAEATDNYLQSTDLTREQVVGRSLFSMLTDNSGNPAHSWLTHLSDSLETVISRKKEHRMESRRYDVLAAAEESTDKRAWRILNRPVLNEDGTVRFILHSVEDVTEKSLLTDHAKHDREALEKCRQHTTESHKELLALFEQSPVAIAVLLKEQLTFLKANLFFGTLVDRKPEELIGKPFLEALPEMVGQGFDVLINKVIETGNHFQSPEVRVLIKRGQGVETIYVDLTYQPMRDGSGSVAGVFIIATDVTFQVVARQQLTESEARFRSMAESSDVLIKVSDEKGQIIYFNQAWVQLTGRKMEELISSGWADLVHPDDRERSINAYLDALRLKERHTIEFRIADSMGEYHWIFATLIPRFTANGAFEGYICSGIDITEQVIARKQLEDSERAFRTFILQAPIAIAILRTRQYVVEIVNEHALEFWGRTSEEVMNRPLFDSLTELRDQGFKEFFDGIYDSGVPVSLTEHPIEFKRAGKQDLFYFNFLYQVLYGGDGRINGLMAIGVDMTLQTKARIKIEEAVTERTKELAQANKQLQQSNAELNQFAYIASHDLQEPLRKVRTYTGLLASTLAEVPLRTKEYLERIENSSSRMQNLIHDVLNFSALPQVIDSYEKVDLNEVVKAVLTDFDLLIEQTGTVITIHSLPALQGAVVQMSQLFTNLFSNSLKFMRKDIVPEISVTSRKLSEQETARDPHLHPTRNYHEIVFRDNGIGFEQLYADRIFVMFQRLHGRADYKGTGIGLAMCKKIVQAHHGLIQAFSEPGAGARFHIILPESQS